MFPRSPFAFPVFMIEIYPNSVPVTNKWAMNKHASPSDRHFFTRICFSVLLPLASKLTLIKAGHLVRRLTKLPKPIRCTGTCSKVCFNFFPFQSPLSMMKHIFQFCFCKIFEDNKIPYQKLLMLSQPYCLYTLLPSMDTQLTVTSSSSQSIRSPKHPFSIVKCTRLPCSSLVPPEHPSPVMMTPSQSIQRISLENRLSGMHPH